MPVAQTRGHAGKALLIAGTAVVLLVVVAFLVAQAASRGDVEINLGDERFEAGNPQDIADEIADSGGLPILYPDLVNRDRHLYVQHLGDDPDDGWLVFGAFDPDEPTCLVELDRDERVLVNACDRAVTYPLDGRGLRMYPVSVEDGELVIDVNELSTTTTR